MEGQKKESLDDKLFNARFDVLDLSDTGSTTEMSTWSDPIRIKVVENPDSIEFIYKETSMCTLTVHPSPPPEERIFKIVFSCKDGKWHKSDRIYGEIIESTDEYYEFED